jgi:hypothetical protein
LFRSRPPLRDQELDDGVEARHFRALSIVAIEPSHKHLITTIYDPYQLVGNVCSCMQYVLTISSFTFAFTNDCRSSVGGVSAILRTAAWSFAAVFRSRISTPVSSSGGLAGIVSKWG